MPNPALWSYEGGPVYNHGLGRYVSHAAHCRIAEAATATDGSTLAIAAIDTGGQYAPARLVTGGKHSAR